MLKVNGEALYTHDTIANLLVQPYGSLFVETRSGYFLTHRLCSAIRFADADSPTIYGVLWSG